MGGVIYDVDDPCYQTLLQPLQQTSKCNSTSFLRIRLRISMLDLRPPVSLLIVCIMAVIDGSGSALPTLRAFNSLLFCTSKW